MPTPDGAKLGVLRRSQLLMQYGPGAIVDYRAGGGTVAAVTLGLHAWDERAAGRLREPALEKLLAAKLREPPVSIKDKDKQTDGLEARRFPLWMECPSCRRLRPFERWRCLPGQAAPTCQPCERVGRTSHPVPARFVVSCDRGHLSDFPWDRWLDHADDCAERWNLRLDPRGAGLRNLYVNCMSCERGRSLNNALSAPPEKDVGCRGERPWLGENNREGCDARPRTLQRGASNVYFSVSISALSIPPWTKDALERAEADDMWGAIVDLIEDAEGDADKMERRLRRKAQREAQGEGDGDPAVTAERLYEAWSALAADYLALPGANDPEGEHKLRVEEWRQFRLGDAERSRDRDFEVRDETVPEPWRETIAAIARVPRLREVRVLTGFTRIEPATGLGDPRIQRLRRGRGNWLPAIENRGEGIFVALNEGTVAAWEGDFEARATVIDEAWRTDWNRRHGTAPAERSEPPFAITARRLLVHSLAHATMTQLALACGYGHASLRERLYIAPHDSAQPMAGFLIYTASADADGTLGGLEREGRSQRLADTLHAAVEASRWCSADPLCGSGISTQTDPLNHAACHSCLFAPETSCEAFNGFLDRGALLGEGTVVEGAGWGFFDDRLPHFGSRRDAGKD